MSGIRGGETATKKGIHSFHWTRWTLGKLVQFNIWFDICTKRKISSLIMRIKKFK